MINPNQERHYFVDEAGDLVLFNRRGKVIIGQEGCSKYFIIGTALLENPHETRRKLAELREQILKDPYLKGIPSLQKTKQAFHAKDDCSEVRMMVFKLLQKSEAKFYAIVRRKDFLVEWVKKQNQFDSEWRYKENKIYDACVKRLFKTRLHQAEINHITFARRGISPRNESLTLALQYAQQNFEKDFGKKISAAPHVECNYPSNEPALQVIDYGLWALQRMYERQEDRFFEFIKEQFRLIIDLDDNREKDYGIYYDDRNQLTLEKIKNSLKG